MEEIRKVEFPKYLCCNRKTKPQLVVCNKIINQKKIYCTPFCVLSINSSTERQVFILATVTMARQLDIAAFQKMRQIILGIDATLPIPTAFPDLLLFAGLLFSTACTVPRFLLVQYGITNSCCFSLLSKWALSREARIVLKTVSTSSALALRNDEQSAWKILHRPLQAACLSRAVSMMGTEKLLNVLPTRRQPAHD